jgi:hypothetical protein
MRRSTSSTSSTSSRRSTLSRRTFLGGAGVMVSLPLLEAMIPRRAQALGSATPQRLLVFYVPNGIHMPAWTPTATGPGFELQPIMQPLAPWKDQLLVVSGLGNGPGAPDGDGAHAAGAGSFLSCTHVNKSETNLTNGTSMDQVLAEHIGGETVIPSMQLGLEGGGNAGNCDSGYACAYVRNISWVGNTPLSKITSPSTAFDLLFAGFDPGASAQDVALRKANRLSVLDRTLDQASALSSKLGTTDRIKLDQYLDSVRDLELKVEAEDAAASCGVGDSPGDPEDVTTRCRVMCDLMAKAFECDRTRTITFMMAAAASLRTFGFLGYPNGHHLYSHHANNPANLAAIQAIDTWEMEQLAYLLGRLAAVTEVDGSTLLDSSLVYCSSEIEDGNTHSNLDLPVLVAGRGGGVVESGRHVTHYGQPVANLYLSLLQAYGVDTNSFGDSNGTIPLG